MDMDADRIAFLFPGQGSQILGMGQLLAESYPAAAETFDEADHILGIPISEICWGGPTEELNDTYNTQPALLTHSIAVLRVLESEFPDLRASTTAGHSLGEFTALVAAEALSFEDALVCVRERGRVMKAAGEEKPGGMIAILGLELDKVEEICEQTSLETGHSVWVANDNCPGQVVISSEVDGLAEVAERFSSAGARKVIRIAVSIAGHCPLLHEAQKIFNKVLEKTPIMDPEIPVIGNVSAALMHTAEEIRADLGSQLITRVRWNQSMHMLISSGVTRCYELGSGKVLSGLMRRINRSIPTLSLDTPSNLVALSDLTSVSG